MHFFPPSSGGDLTSCFCCGTPVTEHLAIEAAILGYFRIGDSAACCQEQVQVPDSHQEFTAYRPAEPHKPTEPTNCIIEYSQSN